MRKLLAPGLLAAVLCAPLQAAPVTVTQHAAATEVAVFSFDGDGGWDSLGPAGDDSVTDRQFATAADSGRQAVTPEVAATPVPEPAPWSMLAIGACLVGLAGRGRRKGEQLTNPK